MFCNKLKKYVFVCRFILYPFQSYHPQLYMLISTRKPIINTCQIEVLILNVSKILGWSIFIIRGCCFSYKLMAYVMFESKICST